MYKVLFIINITKDAAELSLSFLVYNKDWNIENIKVITEFIQQEKWQWKSNKWVYCTAWWLYIVHSAL